VTKFLVVFDVDSTLIEDEVIEVLAEAAGKRDEVKAITDAAMAGDLDFTQSLAKRVAMLEGVPESVVQDAVSRVTITQGAINLIAEIHARGGKAAAVSGGFIQVLEPLADKLGLDLYRANTLEIVAGKLTGKTSGKVIDKFAKAESLRNWAAELQVPLSQTIAVGDGANDLEMMRVAALGVAFNAKPLVRAQAPIVLGGENLAELVALLPH
jgi:phosphoserine phosphatase